MFRHGPALVYDLRVQGEPLPIGVTASHPFWSVDRGEWVPVGQLREGERLLAEDGSTPMVEAFTPRPKLEMVVNIEVDGDHCYRVGQQGLLVHNVSDPRCCFNYEEDMRIAIAAGKGDFYPGPYFSLEPEPGDRQPGEFGPRRDFDRNRQILVARGVLETRAVNANRSDYPNDPCQMVDNSNPNLDPAPQADHIAPYEAGGSNSFCNIRFASRKYNLAFNRRGQRRLSLTAPWPEDELPCNYTGTAWRTPEKRERRAAIRRAMAERQAQGGGND